jgi:hypothetical protein
VLQRFGEGFNPQTHFIPRGGYEGMPLVDRAGNVAIGNHRAQAIKTMSDEQYRGYIEGMRDDFPEAFREYEKLASFDPLKAEYFTQEGKLDVKAFKNDAAPFRELDFTIENFRKEFPDNKTQTPIGEVYIHDSQYNKMGAQDRNREAFFGLIKPTLNSPLFIVEKGGTKHFIKPFVKDDGRIIFHSVAKKNDEGGIYIASNYPIREGYAKGIFRDGEIIYAHARRLTKSSAHSRMRDEIIPNIEPKNQRLMVVRVLDANEDTLKRIAKLSNEGRLFGEKEKIIANEAKYSEKLNKLFDPERGVNFIESETELKNRLGAAEETQANQAMIGRLNDATPNAIDRYMRENSDDVGTKMMIYRNAYAFYNLRQAANNFDNAAIDLNVILPRSLDRMRIAGKNAKQNAEALAADYIERLTKYGGRDVEGDLVTANDLSADILGLAIRRFRAMKDEGVVELGRRIDDLIIKAKEQRQPSLFEGEIAPMDRIDAALEIYGERNSAALQEAARLIRELDAARNAAKSQAPQTPRVDRAERVKDDLAALDPAALTDEQKLVREVYLGNQPETLLRGKDESDLITFFAGSKKSGARKILLRHGGIEAKGGLTPQELLEIGDVIRNGKLAGDSFTQAGDSVRYAYNLTRDGVNFRVVIEETNNGKKAFDLYSDRNTIKTEEPKQTSRPSSATETIPQNAAKSQESAPSLRAAAEAKVANTERLIAEGDYETTRADLNNARRELEALTPEDKQALATRAQMRNYIERGYEPFMSRVIDERSTTERSTTKLDDGRVVRDEEARAIAKEALDEIDETRSLVSDYAEIERAATDANGAIDSAIDGFSLRNEGDATLVKPPIMRADITAAQEKIAQKYGGVWNAKTKEFAFYSRENASKFITEFAADCGI